VESSLKDYLQYNIYYDCFSNKNIVVGENARWQLSVVGFLNGVDLNCKEYYNPQISMPVNKITFQLGCLLFKLLFGFSPIVSNSVDFRNFNLKKYMKYLQV